MVPAAIVSPEVRPNCRAVRKHHGKSSAENAVKRLIEEGVLVKHGSRRAVYYTRSDTE